MKAALRLSSVLVLSLFPKVSLAHHPNEGSLTLDSLVAEASEKNLDLMAAVSKLKAAEALESGSRSAFMPEVSIEGGQLETKLSTERYSSTPVYGKLEWNLYRGGKDESLLKIRSSEARLIRLQVEFLRAKIGRDIARVFYEQQFLLEAISLKEKALGMNADQMKLAQAKSRSGFTSSADVIEFELREATLRSDIKRLEQERNDQSRKMSILIGATQPSSDLLVKGHLVRPNLAETQESVLSMLSNSNPDLVEANLQREIASRESRASRAGYLPQVDFEGKYGKIANEEKTFGEANGYSAFLKVKVPLFSGFSTTFDQAATSAKLKEREVNVSQKRLLAEAEVASLFSKVSTIQNRLDLEEKTLTRSEEYYKITVGEYRRGIKNSPDMAGATERLIEARVRNLELRKDLMLARLDILALVGGSPPK